MFKRPTLEYFVYKIIYRHNMHTYLESQKVVLIKQFVYSYHIILRCQEYRRKNKEKCKIV